MKRNIIILLFLLSVALITGCTGDESHTHTFDSKWESNESVHWKKCTVNGCTFSAASGEHSFDVGEADSFGNFYEVCTICGYKVTKHEHVYSKDYSFDDTYHWYACNGTECSEIADKKEHSLMEYTLSNGGVEIAKCSSCAYVKERLHVHSFSDKFTFDESQHFKECLIPGCKFKAESAFHNMESAGVTEEPTPDMPGKEKFVCSVCGMVEFEDVQFRLEIMSESEWKSRFGFLNVTVKNNYRETRRSRRHNNWDTNI